MSNDYHEQYRKQHDSVANYLHARYVEEKFMPPDWRLQGSRAWLADYHARREALAPRQGKARTETDGQETKDQARPEHHAEGVGYTPGERDQSKLTAREEEGYHTPF